MSSPAVTVVIPLYQKGRSVLAAVRSVLSQRFADLELLVVDDGSTDEGPALVAQVTDPRLRLLRQPNQGPGAARNRGLAGARGALIAFLDADDEWDPEFLELGVAALTRAPECAAWVAGRAEGPARRIRTARDRRMGLTGRWRVSSEVSPRRLKYYVDFCHSSCILARRSAVERYGGYYAADRCVYGEDSYLWLQLVLNHPLAIDPEPRVWFHTEHSELGAARVGRHPVRPALLASEPLLQQCDPAYRRALRDLLAYYRLLLTEQLLRQRNLDGPSLARWRAQFPWTRFPGLKLAAMELRCSIAAMMSGFARTPRGLSAPGGRP
ncbi:MAG TPA: glycosyltransferase family 2 protein [Gemmatimonadales bacterium]